MVGSLNFDMGKNTENTLINNILFLKIPKIMQVLANEPRKDMHSICKEFNTSIVTKIVSM
jgi:hypothetical protein